MSEMDEIFPWHRRTGNLKFDNIIKVTNNEATRNFPEIIRPRNHVCRHCFHGNQTRKIFKVKEHITFQRLEIIRIDLCGPTRTKIFEGEH